MDAKELLAMVETELTQATGGKPFQTVKMICFELLLIDGSTKKVSIKFPKEDEE